MTLPASLVVVDAKPRSRATIAFAFEREGCEVVATGDPREAVLLLRRRAPELVVASTSLGPMQPLEFLETLRGALRRTPPVVMVGDAERRAETIAAGASEFVPLPAFLRDVVTVGRIAVAVRAAPGRAGGERPIEGAIEDYGIFFLARALAVAHRSATIAVEREGGGVVRAGELRFVDGRLVGARLERLVGEAALLHLVLWESGWVRVTFGAPAESERGEIGRDTFRLLDDAERFRVRFRNAVERVGGAAAVWVRDEGRLAEVRRQIPHEVGALLASYDGRRGVLDVVEDSPFRAMDTVVITHRLAELGAIARAPESVESPDAEDPEEPDDEDAAIEEARRAVRRWLSGEISSATPTVLLPELLTDEEPEAPPPASAPDEDEEEAHAVDEALDVEEPPAALHPEQRQFWAAAAAELRGGRRKPAPADADEGPRATNGAHASRPLPVEPESTAPEPTDDAPLVEEERDEAVVAVEREATVVVPSRREEEAPAVEEVRSPSGRAIPLSDAPTMRLERRLTPPAVAVFLPRRAPASPVEAAPAPPVPPTIEEPAPAPAPRRRQVTLPLEPAPSRPAPRAPVEPRPAPSRPVADPAPTRPLPSTETTRVAHAPVRSPAPPAKRPETTPPPASPTRAEPARPAVETRATPSAKHAAPTREPPSPKHATEARSTVSTKHAAPPREQAPTTHAAPTREEHATKHAAPAREEHPTKHAAPPRDEHATRHVAPAREEHATKHVAHAREEKATKHVAAAREEHVAEGRGEHGVVSREAPAVTRAAVSEKHATKHAASTREAASAGQASTGEQAPGKRDPVRVEVSAATRGTSAKHGEPARPRPTAKPAPDPKPAAHAEPAPAPRPRPSTKTDEPSARHPRAAEGRSGRVHFDAIDEDFFARESELDPGGPVDTFEDLAADEPPARPKPAPAPSPSSRGWLGLGKPRREEPRRPPPGRPRPKR